MKTLTLKDYLDGRPVKWLADRAGVPYQRIADRMSRGQPLSQNNVAKIMKVAPDLDPTYLRPSLKELFEACGLTRKTD